MIKKSAPKKVKVVRALGGWTLYEYDKKTKLKEVTLVYGHDSGAWVIFRPLKSGIPMMVFAPDGDVTGDTEKELRELTKYVMRGTSGIDRPLEAVTREGGEKEAYIEYDL